MEGTPVLAGAGTAGTADAVAAAAAAAAAAAGMFFRCALRNRGGEALRIGSSSRVATGAVTNMAVEAIEAIEAVEAVEEVEMSFFTKLRRPTVSTSLRRDLPEAALSWVEPGADDGRKLIFGKSSCYSVAGPRLLITMASLSCPCRQL